VSDDPRFAKAVQQFNSGTFFEAHQTWELIWHELRGSPRDFYKGLIQIALLLHHFRSGNTRGARKLYISCQRYLTDLRPRHGGVDLDKLMSDLDACCAELMACEDETPTAQLDAKLIPRLHWEPTDGVAG
jgi:predicted metal-dependent hydrolase